MLTCKNNTLRRWTYMFGAAVLVATLSACGGGDDAPPPPPPPPPADVVDAPATAAPAINPSSGFTQAGNLNYLVTAPGGSTRTVAATVAYSAPNGTLTLNPGADALTVTTTDAWANVTWPAGVSGALRAEGNAGLVCAEGSGEVGVSNNMVPVTDLTVLHGLSFQLTECSSTGLFTGPEVLTFNANGTATIRAGTPGAETISAADVTAAFSAAGLTDPDTSNFKLRLYAYTAGGVTQYHIVEIGEEFVGAGQPKYQYVGLFSAGTGSVSTSSPAVR